MCNLYSHTRAVDAIRRLFSDLPLTNLAGNLEPGRFYPDQLAPILRHAEAGEGLELARSRWGLPTPPSLLKTTRDPGVSNLRNLGLAALAAMAWPTPPLPGARDLLRGADQGREPVVRPSGS